MVDTGAETSLIDPRLAGQLGIKPEFRTEIITQLGSTLSPGAKVRTVRIGQTALPEMELVFRDLPEARRLDASVKGLLGVNALRGLDFSLSPPAGKLEFSGRRPEGEVVPFSTVEGRIALKARMGEENLTLILDSGATHVVLFRTPAAMAKIRPVASIFSTLDGARAVVPTTWTADMFFADRMRIGTLPAAIVQRKESNAEGLLPASVFQKIYVDRSRSELVLVR